MALHDLVLEEMKRNPGVRYEYGDQRLIQAVDPQGRLKRSSIGWAQWHLAHRGLIAKERRGRKVYFYYPDARPSAGGGPGTQVGASALRYTVTYSRDEDGYIVASVPALPGCHSQGRSKEEARRNIREAMRGYLASLKHRGLPLPREEVEQVEVAL